MHTKRLENLFTIPLREELNNVAQRSVDNIIANKEAEKLVPLSEDEALSRKLFPEFAPEKYHRKNHTLFDTMGEKKRVLPTINRPVTPLKTNRFPERKQQTITTEEMKKPKTTSVGVLPSRSSKDISQLKLCMEGRQAINDTDNTLEAVEQVNKISPPASEGEEDNESLGDLRLALSALDDPELLSTKPAILSQTGAIQTVRFCQRQKPPPRPSFLHKYKKRLQSSDKSSRSIHSSLRSGDITLPSEDDGILDYEDGSIETAVGVADATQDGRLSNASSAGTVKSMKQLIEEAKKIAQPDSEHIFKQHLKPKPPKSPRSPKSPRRKKSKKDSKANAVTSKESSEQTEVRTERTVDEIIASLRNPTKAVVRDYQRALRLDPMCLPAKVNLAYTLQVEGHLMQAWEQFTSAIEVKPTYKPALEGRAIVNLQMSNMFGASQDITASIKVQPTAELLTNRGVIHQFMNDSINAMRDYQAAIKLDKTYSLAYFNMGNVNFHTRHFKQALDNYDKAVEFNNKDESAFLNRAITKVLLRDAQGALSDFKTAIILSPHSAHMYFNRGNLYTSLQQYDRAEKDYNKALELVPDDALTLKRRADVRGKLGKREEAVADYKHAIEIQGRPNRYK